VDASRCLQLIRELCSFEGRLAGTDAERRAAGHLAERLRALGRRVEVEPTYVHPQYALVHAAHCVLGFGGSLLAVAVPPAGFALVLLAATSMYLDLNYRLYLMRRLFFRRASQNVVSPGAASSAPERLILTAHYDAARTGAAFRPARVALLARLSSRLRLPVGPFRILFWSLAVLLPLLGARMAGVEATAISALQLVPTLALVVGAFALVDIALSPVVPGANDSASGSAAVIAIAEELDRDPPRNLDVWVVLTGGGESLQEGMRAFVRAHRADLEPERTRFLAIGPVGRGEVRLEAVAGWVVSQRMDPRLIELSEAIAEADSEGARRFGAAALHDGMAGDAMPPRLAGYGAIGLSCRDESGAIPDQHRPSDTPERIDPAALARACGFALELVRVLDRDAGRRAGGR
jgi:hypothetical protein